MLTLSIPRSHTSIQEYSQNPVIEEGRICVIAKKMFSSLGDLFTSRRAVYGLFCATVVVLSLAQLPIAAADDDEKIADCIAACASPRIYGNGKTFGKITGAESLCLSVCMAMI
jgi:hypothetical protein